MTKFDQIFYFYRILIDLIFFLFVLWFLFQGNPKLVEENFSDE